MKRLLFVISVVLGLGAMVAMSAPAWAHVVVSPEVVTAGDYETLTVSVPTEKEVPTTKIRVEVPEGFLLSGVQPVPGWEHSFEEKGGVVTAVTFSGGEIRPREFQQFLLQAQAPEEPGEYPWKAFQTYEDGSVVEWSGAPDSEEPASVIEVVSGGSEPPSPARSLRKRAPLKRLVAKLRSLQRREGRTWPSMQGLASLDWYFRLC
jgi:uncharacterized protein YcnI